MRLNWTATFVCEICQESYDDPDDAAFCEENHRDKSNFSIVDVEFDNAERSSRNNFPDILSVMESGDNTTVATYEIVSVVSGYDTVF